MSWGDFHALEVSMRHFPQRNQTPILALKMRQLALKLARQNTLICEWHAKCSNTLTDSKQKSRNSAIIVTAKDASCFQCLQV